MDERRRQFVLGGGAAAATLALLSKDAPADSPASSRSSGIIGVPPEAYGADGTVAKDSAGLRRAVADAAHAVDLAPRTYLLDAAALSRMPLSGKTLRGVRGQTRIKLTANPGADLLSTLGSSDFAIEDIIFDASNLMTGTSGMYRGYQIPLFLGECRRFRVAGCQILNFHSYGLLANVVREARIEDNYVHKPSPSGAYANYAIGVSGSAAAASSNVLVSGNTCVGSDITINAVRARITGNDVSGWGFSAGINVAEAPASSNDIVVALNHVHDPAATPDMFNFYLDGIECWAGTALVALNSCHGSIGNGISFGGPNSIVSNNLCWDNGSVERGQSAPAGWGIRALADKLDASGSVVVGNRCFDTRAAGAKMQQYGYGENAVSFTGIKVWGNDFDGNGTGPLDIKSPDTRVDGYRSGIWTPRGANTRFAAASGTYRVGPMTTLVTFDVTLPPTRDTTVFSIDGLPTRASAATGCNLARSPTNDLRLYISAGSKTISADTTGGPLTNQALSGRRIIGSCEYPN